MFNTMSDKKIVVVGANGLLGKSIVDELLAHSCEVIATDIRTDNLEKIYSSNKRVTIYELDICSEAAIAKFFTSLGVIHGAVNSSYPRNKSYGDHFFDVTIDNFNENVSLNLGSSFCFSKHCALHFLKYKHDFSLVNVASVYGVIAPKFDIYEKTTMSTPVEYAAIKSALIHLSKYISSYVNDSRFRVNTVSPGGIIDDQNPIFVENYRNNTHGKGMLDPSDIVGAILFLLSEQSKFIVGQNLIVDDGFTL